jgi:hypothetical protein
MRWSITAAVDVTTRVCCGALCLLCRRLFEVKVLADLWAARGQVIVTQSRTSQVRLDCVVGCWFSSTVMAILKALIPIGSETGK